MAEVVGITAGIGSILKALGSAGVYLNTAVGASREAQDIANQVHATEAILKSLKASLRTTRRSDEFYEIWSQSTKIVFQNVKITVDDLNGRLGAQKGKARLSLWGKAKWPLAREDSLLIQQHMQAHMQILSMIQNALMQGNLNTVQQSAQDIDDIFTEIGTFPTFSSLISSTTWSISLETVPTDSVSQVGETKSPVARYQPPPHVHSHRRKHGVPSDSVPQIVATELLAATAPSVAQGYGDTKVHPVPDSSKVTCLEVESSGSVYDGLEENLGPGKVTLTLEDDDCEIHLSFFPETLQDFVSKWAVFPLTAPSERANESPGPSDVVWQPEFELVRFPHAIIEPTGAPRPLNQMKFEDVSPKMSDHAEFTKAQKSIFRAQRTRYNSTGVAEHSEYHNETRKAVQVTWDTTTLRLNGA